MNDANAVRIEGPQVRLELLPLGATLRRFEVRLPDGTWRNLVLGAPTVEDYLVANRYLGMSIGRFANRIAGGRITIDGVTRSLDVNEPPNQLHGGTDGFHARVWNLAGNGNDWAEFTLTSPDGDQGYPGEVHVSARYELVDGGAQVTYRATTDAPTVVNLTNHSYFNLEGEGAGDTDRHVLMIHASRYTPNRADGIPTGEVRDVTGSAADFREGRPFGAARLAADAEGITRNDGFDHNFIIDGEGLREHCRLVGADGVSLLLLSDQPALQVYGGEHFDGSQLGNDGRPHVKRAGIALETQNFPDAPNHPHFPDPILRPGEVYLSTTRWLLDASAVD